MQVSGVGGVAVAPPGGSASSVNYRLPLLWRPAAGGGSLCVASCASSGGICSLTGMFTVAAPAPERGTTSKGGGGSIGELGGGHPVSAHRPLSSLSLDSDFHRRRHFSN